jgi:hypothetical protein
MPHVDRNDSKASASHREGAAGRGGERADGGGDWAPSSAAADESPLDALVPRATRGARDDALAATTIVSLDLGTIAARLNDKDGSHIEACESWPKDCSPPRAVKGKSSASSASATEADF